MASGRSGYNASVPIRFSTLTERLTDAVERAEILDPVAARLAALTGKALARGRARDVLSGTALGHPAHPGLVVVPLGTLMSATTLDIVAGNQGGRAARRLIAVGLLSAVPAAASGASDWLDTEGAERRVGLVHWVLNAAGLGLYGWSWVARGREQRLRGVMLGVAGAGVMAGSGWLGGHLAYALGVGVDTTAFTHLSDEWCEVGDAAELGEIGATMTGLAGGTQVLVVRTSHGLVALADRCTHRGGPLHDGTITGDCVTCPWHGSCFDLSDGSVVTGPATRPQPMFETRELAGRIEVRRADEQRALRTNPV